MKINLILLALTSLFFTVLGHPGVVAPSPTTTTPAETCHGFETKCSRNKANYDLDRNAIIKCWSDTVYYQTCSPSDICADGPPVACTPRFHSSTFGYIPSATYATSPADPCASTDASTATLPGHHIHTASLIHTIHTASRIHTASHTRPASPTDTDSSSSDSDCSDSSSSSDSSDDEAA